MRLILAALLILAIPGEAWAKKVNLEWKPIKGAVSYEVQVMKDGKAILKEPVETPAWSGSLDTGVYTYHLRAIDKVKRAGQWSSAKPLVVTPKPPELEYPADTTLTLYDPGASGLLKWEPAEGCSRYVVTVKQGPKVIARQMVKGTQMDIKGLTPGKYTWQVAAVMEAGDRVPASLKGRTWESKPSEPEEFTVDIKQLGKPIQVYPKETVSPPRDGKLSFEWKKVEGAEAYEIQVFQVDKEGRALASAEPQGGVKKFISKDIGITIPVPGEGKRKWVIRALANVSADRKPGAYGPQSSMDFKLDRNADFWEGSGYLALSGLLSPYTYRTEGNIRNPSAQSSSVTIRGSAEYYFRPQWGVSVGAEQTTFTMNNENYNRFTGEFTLKYRMNLGKDKYSWSFAPKAGIEFRDWFLLEASAIPSSSSNQPLSSQSFSTTGPTFGFDLRKAFSEKLSLGVKVGYYYPMKVSRGTLSGGASSRNLSVGIQGLYWVGKRVGVGVGGFMENRSIGVQDVAQNTDEPVSVYTDALHLFTSLIYTFGQ